MIRIALLLCSLFLAWGMLAVAAEGPSAALGKSLFESTTLGTNGRSCSTCHPAGKGLKKIAVYDDDQLKGIINSCISGALKGKKFTPDAQELNALLAYLRSLQKN
jgi:cytochrome c